MVSMRIVIACMVLGVVLEGCNPPVALHFDNPHDPGSANWVPDLSRPSISNVKLTANYTVLVIWIYSGKNAVVFKLERKKYGTNDYTKIYQVDAISGGYTYQYEDTTSLPRGYTYAYRVGVVSPTGTEMYSYDFDVDVY